MIKCKKLICISFFILCFSIFVKAQNIAGVEANLSSLKNNLMRNSARLDSLKAVLDIRAKRINDEKKKPDPDKSLIVSLMSGSANLANEIESTQNTIALLEKNIEYAKEELNKIYSSKIDSLSALEKSGAYKGNKEELKSLILFYTEKKLLVTPKIALLSFHPDKILGIDLKKTSSPEERKLYEEYIKSALSEVNDRLNNLSESLDETARIISLEKKTNKFLEETEFDYDITPRSTTRQLQPANANQYGSVITEDASKVRASYEQNASEYGMLLSQLNFKPVDPKIKWIDPGKGKNSIGNLSEYNELLKEVKKRLQEYKLILTHKLNSVK